MPETTSRQWPDRPYGIDVEESTGNHVAARVRGARTGFEALLREADDARRHRAEATGDGTAVCAWNHFENIPTFYNWNNRPR
ncbi:multiple cyclophane-containing RiPP AmcA [Micromonospora zhanjiangensis]|uniref:Multiple cyclophane-containing RiPP AmcA n=1 Tax=Micromonospora zhanjiangensis TaxID=1522057 RepID=A0ABV8KUH9_9ACTN